MILKLTSAGKAHKLHEVNENGVQCKPDRGMSEGAANKYVSVDGKRENGGNYQRALTLLNEAAGILTSPATATDASDRQPQLSQHSNLQLQYKFQVSGTSERKEMARLFPF